MEKGLVYVGMSGGVDSAVAAALLKRQGYDVVGVFMKPWQPGGDEDPVCLWKQDREDALRAAAAIGIPFKTWDFSREYKKSVTDYLIREYRAGRTPNPDVMCNKEIKFGLFLKKALAAGADFIATGHYVRLKKTSHGIKLYQAKDSNKDQSYFLWTLTQRQLARCIFPIGDYTKPEVRVLAKKYKLPNYAKKDSQGVCFIGPLDMKEFLTGYIKPKPGKILALDGRKIGAHDGVYYYTIGQRHGLDIADGSGPYYVIGKDVAKNVLYVGEDAAAALSETRVKKCNWIGGSYPAGNLDVKVRYRAPSARARLAKDGTLEFAKPERAVTQGQSAVFYRGRELLGGGIIV
ncbi:MAG TPA: tRNA 2-thiouridine(34) synthase MnmA [Candidatus Paceibacterota bacterium]|nr:tRNA 2-thiouridine(34) synthase MnmA [Candidatus Paceibacterota bacterium]